MKSIKLQCQRLGNNTIPPIKDVGWFSATVDNVKISIDAYKDGSGYAGTPRTDSLMEIADEREVFELTPEQLLHIIRFYVDYASDKDSVIHYRNKHHYIARDSIKVPQKG